MSAKLVNSSGEICVQFPCERCGKPFVAGLKDLGGTFRCRDCGSLVQMPSVPCPDSSCGGRYRRCNGAIQVLPAEEELRRAEAVEWETRESEREELERSAAPTDDYHDAMGDLRASVHGAAMCSVTRYRCGRCGRRYSWFDGQRRGYESGRASCAEIACSDCERMPSVDELPEPDSLFNRPLEATYPFVWLDTAEVRVQEPVYVDGMYMESKTVTMEAVITVGALETGEREILACHVPESRDQAFWVSLLSDLAGRGVGRVGLVIARETEGLRDALFTVFPRAALQRCRTSFLKDVVAEVPPAQRKQVKASLKTIFQQPEARAASQLLRELAAGLEPSLPTAAHVLIEGEDEVLTYMAFPRRQWPRICSLDAFASLNKEVREEGVYADARAALSRAKADALRLHTKWRSEGRYLSPGRLPTVA